MKRLHALKTVVANKWLNETTDAVGDNRCHYAVIRLLTKPSWQADFSYKLF